MTVKEFFETNGGNLCIHCDTERKANKLLKKFHELGKCWCSGRSYLEYNLYDRYGKDTVYCNDNSYCSLNYARSNAKVIIEFDELDDFKYENTFKNMFKNVNGLTKFPKLELNHEKDVFDYGFNHLITLPKEKFNKNYIVQFLGQWSFQIPQKNMLIVNKEKKYVLLKIKGKEYRVDCHKDDKFDWLIGFGLALSKAFGKNAKWEETREFYRNKNRKLNYKEYAKWCVVEYFNNDMIEINNLKNKIKEINEYGKVDL